MKYLVLDVESTTKNKGSPFEPDNKLCSIGTQDGVWEIEHSSQAPYGEALKECQDAVDNTDILVFFNAKFDLHWLRRYGILFQHKKVWDCQLAHFLMTRQTHRYPSLDDVAEYWGEKKKLDVVKTEYWEKGIDTDQVPWTILEEYNEYDCLLTEAIYHKQRDYYSSRPELNRLLYLQHLDLIILEEMEWNGMKYDVELSRLLSEETKRELESVSAELNAVYPGTPINWNSTDQVSAFLYGGTIKHDYQYEDGVFKSGKRAGQPRLRWATEYYDLPQLVKPLRGSELAKEGLYATDQGTLRQLKASKKVRRLIDLLLKESELEKLIGTYYDGLISKCGTDGIIHGRFNQCVAATGRLSSSDPNLQNFDGRVDQCLVSRF